MSKELLDEIAYSTVYFCPMNKLNDDLEGTFNYTPSDVEVLRSLLLYRAVEDEKFDFAALILIMPEEELRKNRRPRGTYAGQVYGPH